MGARDKLILVFGRHARAAGRNRRPPRCSQPDRPVGGVMIMLRLWQYIAICSLEFALGLFVGWAATR